VSEAGEQADDDVLDRLVPVQGAHVGAARVRLQRPCGQNRSTVRFAQRAAVVSEQKLDDEEAGRGGEPAGCGGDVEEAGRRRFVALRLPRVGLGLRNGFAPAQFGEGQAVP
jgi:hypothetical protein